VMTAAMIIFGLPVVAAALVLAVIANVWTTLAILSKIMEFCVTSHIPSSWSSSCCHASSWSSLGCYAGYIEQLDEAETEPPCETPTSLSCDRPHASRGAAAITIVPGLVLLVFTALNTLFLHWDDAADYSPFPQHQVGATELDINTFDGHQGEALPAIAKLRFFTQNFNAGKKGRPVPCVRIPD